MNNALLSFGLTVSLLGLACDSKEQCVADCGGQGSSESSSGGDSGETSEAESSSGGASLLCEQHRDDATAFIEQNRECQTVLDCIEVDGLCYAGDVSNPCGSVGLSADADLVAWQGLAGEMSDNCECDAGDPCGSAVMCNDEQQCESSFGSEAYCPSIERDVETFLAANRACEVDEDCTQLDATCYVDECSVVAVNTDTSVEDWTRLDEELRLCDGGADELCNFVGDCGAGIRCGEAGECVAEFS
ncbi:MAG: hypothetical protein KUG77_09975 [Nannocystaceae bacterium]|nr:hypothetical protein [Nannocystaceae bacterium]